MCSTHLNINDISPVQEGPGPVPSTAADFPNCFLAGQALEHQFGAVEEGGEEGGPGVWFDEQGHPGGRHVCDGHLLDAAVHHGESSHGSIAAGSKYNIPRMKEKTQRNSYIFN